MSAIIKKRLTFTTFYRSFVAAYTHKKDIADFDGKKSIVGRFNNALWQWGPQGNFMINKNWQSVNLW